MLAHGRRAGSALWRRRRSETRAFDGASRRPGLVVLARGSGYGGGTNAVRCPLAAASARQHGLTPGPIDGRYGPRTEHAVELFQSAHGLRVDGIAGPITLSALRTPSYRVVSGSRLRRRRVRAACARLQRRLAPRRVLPGTDRWSLRTADQRAVSRFQSAHDLQVDGIAGRQTFGELKVSRAGQRPTPRVHVRTAPSSPRRTIHPRPSHPAAPQPNQPARTGQTPQAGLAAGWDLMAGRACGARAGLPRGARGRRVAGRRRRRASRPASGAVRRGTAAAASDRQRLGTTTACGAAACRRCR